MIAPILERSSRGRARRRATTAVELASDHHSAVIHCQHSLAADSGGWSFAAQSRSRRGALTRSSKRRPREGDSAEMLLLLVVPALLATGTAAPAEGLQRLPARPCRRPCL